MTLKPVLALILLAAAPAFAEPGADAPTATQDPAVAAQISAWLAASPAATPAAATLIANDPPTPGPPDRKIHGVAEVAVGSHGYRSVYLETHMPLGGSGELTVAIGDSRGGGFRGPTVCPPAGPPQPGPRPCGAPRAP